MNFEDKVVTSVISGIAVFLTVGIIGAIYFEQKNLEVKQQAVATIAIAVGREIPKCDKPLWDRITDGCGE